MNKTRFFFSLSAVVLSVAGGFSTTLAKVFVPKDLTVQAALYTKTGTVVCTQTATTCAVRPTGVECTGREYFSDASCSVQVLGLKRPS